MNTSDKWYENLSNVFRKYFFRVIPNTGKSAEIFYQKSFFFNIFLMSSIFSTCVFPIQIREIFWLSKSTLICLAQANMKMYRRLERKKKFYFEIGYIQVRSRYFGLLLSFLFHMFLGLQKIRECKKSFILKNWKTVCIATFYKHREIYNS